MSGLCSQRDHSRKETFGRGAVKLCGECEGDAFRISHAFSTRFLQQRHKNGMQLRTRKNNSASYAG